ncbi:MAG: zinc ribbon domain-containing protein [Flavobacteriales bacterium]|jgi:predicted  nucleic acid-binding Zn-ribbon protein|nr:C4-type zinc ribbon domain-containing protein [Flavobacteriales bacterium]|tara:strand:+ start:8468 stop:9214 length:747 start_codon:yes stop_codon:yes gene_type:complete
MAKEKVTISVEDRLRALHQLQIIDSEVDKIRIVRGELPVEIEDLEDLIVGLKTRLEKLTNELEVVNTDLTAKKTSILDASELVKKYDKQLKNIKNNREFSSLTKELEYKNLEIELNEKHVNDLQAKILHKNEVIEASTLQINEREDELKVKNTELEAIVKETEKEEKALMKKSDKAQKVIEERLLNSYSRIRGSVKNGLAVVSVSRDACGGCFNQVPPQRQLDIQMHKKVIVCEHCGRILVDGNLLDG